MHHTDDHRVYAIGDIHGCRAELEALQQAIREDLARSPHSDPVIIYLGDFTDRGPDSRGVIDNLIAEQNAPHRTRFLFGNHEGLLLEYYDNPRTLIRPNGPRPDKIHWLHKAGGGAETLRSYGVEGASDADPEATHAAFRAALPDAHRRFFGALELSIRIGSYLFVHAGIQPDVPLDAQSDEDLIWMREPFLSHRGDYGFTVVHGHTPTKTVENHGNRIGIDTGAVFGGPLSCVVLEGSAQEVLSVEGRAPCPVIA